VPLEVAAAVAIWGTTAHVHTREVVRPGAGDAVVVQAAAGATGGEVVQLAAAAGATVIALASTPAKAAAARALGVAHAFRALRDAGPGGSGARRDGGAGAAHVYDAGGGDAFDASLAMVATRGALVLYGQSSGPVEPFVPGAFRESPATTGPDR
jgi:NADPH2:quinone reductase